MGHLNAFSQRNPLARLAARLIASGAIAATAVACVAAAAAPAAASSDRAAASVSAPAAVPQTVLTWHPLTLINGWKSASQPKLLTGTPAWALSKGVVYLRGAVKQTTAGGSSVLAVLPQAARPARNLFMDVYTNGLISGVVYVGTNGTLDAYDGNATVFASLSAISYPATTMKSHGLALENGWKSAQPSYATGDPSYEVSGGVVYLSGSLAGGNQHLFAVLPKAARPAQRLYIQVYTFEGTPGWLLILPSGQVEAFGHEASEYTSLAGVSFPVAATKWHTFALEGGWVSNAAKYHTAAPAYTVINGVVYLNGTMDEATEHIGLWANLPAAVRTAADVLEIEVDTANGNPGDVAITSSLGLAGSLPATNAQAFTSLSGIAYPQNS
jgi:hypothetical protein